nr:copia protein [Tanacetum cinerariifolium]
MKVEESLNVTFDESPPPSKLSPLVDDDLGEEEAIKKYTKVINNNYEEDESLEVDEVVSIKKSKNHPLGTRWVFRNKLDEKGTVSRNKARLVAQGYNQQEGIDYDETYALVARLESIRILLAIAYANDFKLYQIDVKSDLINGFINEEVYVAQPSSFIDIEKPNYVYKLKKALYGLKQAPKAWRMAYFKDRKDKILPYGMILTRLFRNLKANMFEHPFDECYVLVPRKMAPLKAKQPKHPPPKRTRNLGKSERTQLPTSSSSDSPPSNNEDLPSTKLSPRSYYRSLPIRVNMSKEQRETRGMFKNLARVLHKFAKILKKKANMFEHPFDECYVLVPRKMAPLKAKQPKNPPPKRTRNLGKSERTQLPTSSSSDSPPSDNEDLPSTKLSPRSYYRALPICVNMSKEQRETRGMFKNLARVLHKFAKILKKRVSFMKHWCYETIFLF